jgi:hypothetical protein
MNDGPAIAPLERFLDAYWKDRQAGTVRSLDSYLAQFPGQDARISHEFNHAEVLKGALIGRYDQRALDALRRARDRVIADGIGHFDMRSVLIGLIRDERVAEALRHAGFDGAAMLDWLERPPDGLMVSKPSTAAFHQGSSDSVNAAKHCVETYATVSALDLFLACLRQEEDVLVAALRGIGLRRECIEKVLVEHPALTEVTAPSPARVRPFAEVTAPVTARTLAKAINAGISSVVHAVRRHDHGEHPRWTGSTKTPLDPEAVMAVGRALGCTITIRPDPAESNP